MSQPQPFLLFPTNGNFAPGESRTLTAEYRPRFFFLIAVPLAMLALLIIEVGYQGYAELAHLSRDGTWVTGQVVRKHTAPSGRQTRYRIAYQFGVPGEEGRGVTCIRETKVQREDHERMETGQLVDVLVVPNQPGLSRLSVELDEPMTWSRSPAWIGNIGFGLLLLLIAVAVGFAGARERRRQRARATAGQRLPGSVVECTASRERVGFYVRLQYRFQTPDGRELRGRNGNVRPDLENKPTFRNFCRNCWLFGREIFRLTASACSDARLYRRANPSVLLAPRRSLLPAAGTPVVVLYLNDKNHQVL